MNVTLWIIQGLLTAMFGMAGIMKSIQPKEKLAEKLPWVNDYSLGMVRFIGLAELSGAIGLILPPFIGIPILTPLAALGLALIMIFAAVYHIRKSENQAVIFNAILLILTLIVAYFRY